MNKKFLSAILFGALMVTSTGTFVSCKDYDDDIDAINKELVDIKSQVAALQSQVNSGSYVTGVTKTADGITFAFSNGSPVTIEIKDGAAGVDGAQGPAGKDGSIVEVKDGVLYIDGVATEIKVCETPVVEESEFLPAVTIVDGEWAVLQEDGTYLSTGYAASSVAVAENEKGGYTLTIKDAEGEETEIELPATKIITDLKATSITDGKMGGAAATLYYGMKVTADDGLTFNGNTYAKGEYLLSQTSKLSAIVNPLDADATKYAYKLVDTKGNAPIVVSGIKQNMSEKALSRADETANQGVWDMTLSFADATKVGADGVYALTAETVNGVVASPYDVTIKTEQVTTPIALDYALSTLPQVKYGTEFDLSTLFSKETWGDKIVDFYFEIADKAAAESKGIVLNGNVVKSTNNATFNSWYEIKANVLFVTGQTHKYAVNVKFLQDAPASELADVEWTITDETSKGENVVYLSLASIQSQLIGSSDASIPTITRLTSTWADGTELNEKSEMVNGVNYGKAVDTEGVTNVTFDESWITDVDGGLYSLNADGDAYVAATSVQNTLYAKFTFDYTTAFPGEYIVNVGFRKNGATSGDYVVVVPVKVVVKAPEVNPFARLAAYFNGNEATAYGKVVSGKVQYNLFDLFKAIDADTKADVVFTETKHDIKNHTCASWFVTGGAKGDIEVGVYNNATDADNKDNVYSTRAMEAVYTVFGNAHIAKVVDSFNLTVKSEIFEGTLEASEAASVSGQVKDVMKVSLKNITAKDVYGEAYYLGETNIWNATTEKYNTMDADARIVSVKLVLVDDNAKEYLAVPSAMTVSATGYPYFTVESANKTTALQSDVTCQLRLEVTDVWGKIKTTDVTVTLKK